jgi:hypothetical protein
VEVHVIEVQSSDPDSNAGNKNSDNNTDSLMMEYADLYFMYDVCNGNSLTT